jgi:hypothetical protein
MDKKMYDRVVSYLEDREGPLESMRFGFVSNGKPHDPLLDMIRPTRSYADKDDFGDVDLLCNLPGLRPPSQGIAEVAQYLEEWPGITEVVYNDLAETISFGIRSVFGEDLGGVVQVDLLFYPWGWPITFAWGYHDYNDLGGFIGTVAKNLGFKLKATGLYYVLQPPGVTPVELKVTSEWSAAIEFLGYDSDRYFKNPAFQSAEDVFDFALSSPYADPDWFLPENLSGEARRRQSKRKMYLGLVDYIEAKRSKEGFEIVQLTKERALAQAFSKFAGFQSNFRYALGNIAIDRLVNFNINGIDVMEQTGVKGPEIKTVLEKLKLSYENPLIFQAEAILNPGRVIDRLKTFKP